MALTAKDTSGGGDYEPVPEGLHRCVCISVYDLGTHTREYQGQEKDRHEVRLVWEIPALRMTWDEKDMPRAFTQTFTLSLHKKAKLRSTLESWRGKSFTDADLKNGFDLSKLLGQPCQIQLIHQTRQDGDGVYAKMSAILPKPEGWSPEPENPTKYFSFEEHGRNIPDGIPEKTLETIKKSYEYVGWPEQEAQRVVEALTEETKEAPRLVQVPESCKFAEAGEWMDGAFCHDKICRKECKGYRDWQAGQESIPF